MTEATDDDNADAPPAAPDRILWTESGAPRSEAFDDVFFSDVDGLAECRHVFQGGVGLVELLALGGALRIGEIGFGVGLNFLAAWQAADQPGAATVDYVGFERAVPSAEEIRQALAPWPELEAKREALLADWPPASTVAPRALTPSLNLTILQGEAIDSIERLTAPRDVWWLDGFSPAKNPTAWAPELLQAIFQRTAPGGRLATYAAAGWVRRGLASAGFEVARAPGFGTKREMLTARKPA